MLAGLMAEDSDDPLLVMGADEFHPVLTGLFDRSVTSDTMPSDGGGGLCLKRSGSADGLKAAVLFYETSENNPSVLSSLLGSLRGRETYGALFAGIPGTSRRRAEAQLRDFLSLSGFEGPVIDYRKYTGEFASASAVASVLAIRFVQRGELPGGLCGRGNDSSGGQRNPPDRSW